MPPSDNRPLRERALAQAGDHRLATRFDPLRYGDFAFAGQKLHRSHFAQIHAHGIVGPTDFILVDIAARVAVAFGFGILGFSLVAFDDIDAEFRQHRQRIFDLLRRNLILGQGRIQLVIGHIAALFALSRQFFDGGSDGIDQWTFESFFLRGLFFCGIRCLLRHS